MNKTIMTKFIFACLGCLLILLSSIVFGSDFINDFKQPESYFDLLSANTKEHLVNMKISQSHIVVEVGVFYEGSDLWFGMKDTEIDGDYAYCTYQHGLQIIDVKDFSNPNVVLNLDLPNGEAWGLDIQDGIAYVADGVYGLIAIDISDPYNPFITSKIITEGNALDVYVLDTLAFVADSWEGLQIIDISESGNYQLLGHVPTDFAAIKVIARGNYAYVANASGGLLVVDIHDPQNPVEIASLNNIGFALDLELFDNYAYLAIENAGLLVVNISDPAHPMIANSITNMEGAYGIDLQGHYAFISHADNNGLMIFDIEDPVHPIEISALDIPGTSLGIHSEGNLVYLAGWQSGLNIVDISDINNPELTGNSGSPGSAVKLLNAGHTTFVASNAWQISKAKVHIIDWINPFQIDQINTYEISGPEITDLAYQDNILYLTDLVNGLQVVDISDHNNPTKIGESISGGYNYCLAVDGNLACLGTDLGLKIHDISEPANLSLIGTYAQDEQITSIELLNQLAFIIIEKNRLEVIDMNDPSQPELLGGYYDAFQITAFDIKDNFIYLTDQDQGLIILDISDLSRPLVVENYEIDSSPSEIQVDYNYAHIADLGDGIQLYNIKNKHDSYLAGYYPTRGYAHDLHANDTTLIVADYYGLSYLSLKKPEIFIQPDNITLTAYEGGNPPLIDSFRITNTGGGRLQWNVVSAPDWAILSATEGIENVDVTVGAEISGLTEGQYQDTIFIDCNGINSPGFVAVSLTLLPRNHAPELTVIGNQIVHENKLLSLNITATDAEGTIPILATSDLPPNTTFADNLDGTGNFEFSPDFEQAGIYYIIFYASENNDPLLTDSEVVQIEIIDVNRPPQFVQLHNDTSIVEDDTLTLLIEVTDPDLEPIALNSIIHSENSIFRYIDSSAGLAEFIFFPDYTDVDISQPVVITATDKGDVPVKDSFNILTENRELDVVSVQTSPSNSGSSDLLLDDSIVIYFNEAVDENTIIENTLVTSEKDDIFDITYDPQLYAITINSQNPEFLPLDNIDITLNIDMQDLAGHKIANTYNQTILTGSISYPGDTDNNGIVDERDILLLGVLWELEGPFRTEIPDCSWQRHLVHQWDPLKATYADADGSGQIDSEDICAIAENWGKTHTEVVSKQYLHSKTIQELLQSDNNILIDIYNNLLDCHESDGKSALLKIMQSYLETSDQTLPITYTLEQNYPNPFNPQTSISYSLPEKTYVTIHIYDLLGREVNTLVNNLQEAGSHSVLWDGTDYAGQAVSSGVYFYKLNTSQTTLTKKMLLLK